MGHSLRYLKWKNTAILVLNITLALMTLPCCSIQADDNKPGIEIFERIKSLEGDWLDQLGTFAGKGEIGLSYRLIANGSAIVETMFPGKPQEMMTVYHLDKQQLVLTHYCAAGNQPKLIAHQINEKTFRFDFSGGSNFDPAKDLHMHEGQLEFIDENHIKGHWQAWLNGKPVDHRVEFDLLRKK